MRNTAIWTTVFCLAVATAAQAGTWTVDQGGGGNFTTIGAALADTNVVDGDTINVNPGTYDEAIQVMKGVVLSGADPTTTFITYSGVSEQIVFLGDNNGETFSTGLTFRNFGLYPSDNLDGDSDLIKLRASGTATDKVVIQNCIFNGNSTGTSHKAKGIEESQHANHVEITGNTFTDCYYGMWLNTPQHATITDNTITNTKYSGLAVCTSDSGVNAPQDILIEGNTITQSGYEAHPDWQDSIFSTGIHLGSTIFDVTITGNDIIDNYAYGIVIHDRDTTDLSNVNINWNNIYDTVLDRGLINLMTTEVNGKCNWWGDASGPSGEGSGSGDAVSTYVDASTWLDGPAPGGNCIPEPATLSLLALGGLTLLRRRRGARR